MRISATRIDNLILTDQAKRLTILEEGVLRTARPPGDREAQHGSRSRASPKNHEYRRNGAA